jgi:predicted nucleic acid-binding protein
MIFVDTSAIYAVADKDDEQHETAMRLFQANLQAGRTLVTHSYVLVESASLLHRGLGRRAAMTFLSEASRFRTQWVSSDLHDAAVEYLRERGTTKMSLVDAVSFVVMAGLDLEEYLAFDEHFANAGYRLVSAP